MTAAPLRLVVALPREGREAVARAIAGLLLRAGIDCEIVARNPDVVLQYVEAAPREETSAPALFIPCKQRSIDDCRDALRELIVDGELRVDKLFADRQSAYDIPSLILFLVEGWDELASPERDSHGRFPHESSTLFQLNALDQPVADLLARAVGDELLRLAGGNRPHVPEWNFCATLDIDSAGMFGGRATLRSFADIARQRPGSLPAAFSEFIRTTLRVVPDPHIRLRMLAEAMEGLDAHATFFVQVNKSHKLDNYDLKRGSTLSEQLLSIVGNTFHDIGLHSSYTTSDHAEDFFVSQWARLRTALGPQVKRVHRAHYLRTPDAMDYGIAKEGPFVDSSLGFGAHPGFRRGTSFVHEVAQGLLELPPTTMDSTYLYWLKQEPEAALEHMLILMQRVRKVGGAFVPVWHPHNMEPLLHPGWREAFFDLVYEAKRRGARLQSLADTARAQHDLFLKYERALTEQAQ
ncbi:hypothetical protein BH09SUM1_BH09SUM1_16970 [soil metagenome]